MVTYTGSGVSRDPSNCRVMVDLNSWSSANKSDWFHSHKSQVARHHLADCSSFLAKDESISSVSANGAIRSEGSKRTTMIRSAKSVDTDG